MSVRKSCVAAQWLAAAAILLFAGSIATRAQAQAMLPASIVPAVPANGTGTPTHPAPGVDTQALSTLHLANIQSDRPVRQASVEKLSSRKSWLILSLVQHGAAGFDAYSTRQAIAAGAVEQDPFMKPFADSPAIYGAIQVAPLALDYVARRMQFNRRSVVRRLWWLPQTASTGLFLFSGAHNMHVAGE
jgi:hypothetical protein